MPGHACSFACNTFHGAAVSEDTVCIIVDDIKSWLVEDCCSMRLRDGKTNSVAEALAEGACCHFNALSLVILRMTRCDAVDLLRNGVSKPCQSIHVITYSEVLQVIH